MSHLEKYNPDIIPKINELREIISKNNSFLLVGHRNPDGDCI